MLTPAPRLRFRSLGSGSAGNGTVVEAHAAAGTARVLLDSGFTLRELTARLAAAGLAPTQLDAMFVTHEHTDHVGCALALARRHRVPLWMSRGTWRAIGSPELDAQQLNFARDGDRIVIGPLLLRPFTVPHDAAEPLQLRFEVEGLCLGVLTDAGSITTHLLNHLQHCDALLLECNHDRELLAASHYPAFLKKRIGGSHGHLSNDTAAQVLSHCLHEGLRHVVAAHLSERNNRVELVHTALAPGLTTNHQTQLHIACQSNGFDWIELAKPSF